MTAVLVVEDDQMFARAVGDDLRYQGLEVSIVHTVADALDNVSKRKYDVLLTDLRLGAQDGIDLLSALRDVSPQTRSVLMSAFATARDYQRAVELGAVRVLCKPFTPADLIQSIQQAVECGVGFCGSVHGLSLVDMLQMYNYARRSVTIAVTGRSPGRLHLRDGQLVHAEHQGRSGEDAVSSILAMPVGTLGTSALPARLPQSITRDFRMVLLDALRAIDESNAGRPKDDEPFEISFDVQAPEQAEPAPIEFPSSAEVLARVREIDGYVAVCLFLASNGRVVCSDGSLDLRPIAPLTAEAMRSKQKTIDEMGIDDEAEDVLLTSTTQYHVLRRIHGELPAFIYLVLDRARCNPTLARHELDQAVSCFDRH